MYFLEVLIERQQKCCRFGINAINPLDEFRLDGDVLEFTNLSEHCGFVDADTRYNVSRSSYDDESDERRTVNEPVTQSRTRIELPDGDGNFLLVEIRSLNEDDPQWSTAVGVYLRPKGPKGAGLRNRRHRPRESGRIDVPDELVSSSQSSFLMRFWCRLAPGSRGLITE